MMHTRDLTIAMLSLSVILTACTKEDTPTPGPAPAAPIPSYSALSIGNTWTYAIVQFDSLGNETPTAWSDVVTVTGDTVLNGNSYSVLEGTRSIHHPWQDGGYVHLLRDSADCLVADNGAILFRANAPGATLRTGVIPPNGTLTWRMASAPGSVSVPAGPFGTTVVEAIATYPGLPQRTMFTHRAANVGLVQEETKFLAGGGGYRAKLVSYQVQ